MGSIATFNAMVDRFENEARQAGARPQATEATEVAPRRGLTQPWSSIEGNPDFADLTYEAQAVVRGSWFDYNAPQKEGWETLGEEGQRYARIAFTSQAPSVNADELTDVGQEFLRLGEAFRSGEMAEEDVSEALSRTFRSSLVSNFTYLRLASNFVGRILYATGNLDESDAFREGDTRLAYSPDTQSDKNAFDYMLSMASQHPDMERRLQARQNMGVTLGVIGDVFTSIKLASPITIGVGKVAAAARAGTIAGRLGRVMSVPIVPKLIQWASEDVFMTVADITRETYNDEITRHEWARGPALRSAVLFGENFILDMAFWNALRLGSRGISTLGNVFRPGGLRRGMEVPRTAKEAVDFATANLPGLDRRSAGLYDSASATRFWRESIDEAVRKASVLGVDDVGGPRWMQTVLESKGYDLAQNAQGGWDLAVHRLVKEGDSLTKVAKLGTFASADNAFVRAVQDLDSRVAGQALEGVEALGTTAAGKMRVTEVLEGVGRRGSRVPPRVDTLEAFLTPGRDGRIAAGNMRSVFGSVAERSGVLSKGIDVGTQTMEIGRYRQLVKKHGGLIVIEDGKARSLGAFFDDVVGMAAEMSEKKARVGKARLVVPDGILGVDDLATIRGSLSETLDRLGKGTREGLSKFDQKAFRQTAKSLTEGSAELRKTAGFEGALGEFEFHGKQLLNPKTGKRVTMASVGGLPVDGGIAVRSGDAVHTYTSLTEARMRELPTDWLTEDVLQKYLKTEMGWDLRKTKEGGYVLRRGSAPLRGNVPYDSIDDLLTKNPDLFPKRPLNTLTQDVEFDYLNRQVRMTSGAIEGGPKEVNEFLNSRFKDYDQTQKVVISAPSGQVTFQPGSPKYLVEMPDIGFKREFSSLEEAKTFLRQGLDDYEVLQDVARAGGTTIEMRGGVFRMPIIAEDGTITEAVSTTLEGMRPHVAGLPFDAEFVPDLLDNAGLPKAVVDALTEKVKKYTTASLNTPRMDKLYDLEQGISRRKHAGQGFRAQRKLGTFFRPTDGVIERVASDIGDHALYEEVYLKPFRGYDIARHKTNIVEKATDGLVRGINQKGRIAIRDSILHPNVDAETIFRKIGATYGPREQEALTATRDIFDLLGREFGIDSYKLLQDYLPRVQDYMQKHPNFQVMESVGEMFSKIPEFKNYRQVPELRFFAENLRAKDMFELAKDSGGGIDELIMSYARKGLRKKYMGGPILEAQTKLTELLNAGTIDEGMGRYFSGFLDELTGLSDSAARADILSGTQDALERYYKEILGKEGTTKEAQDIFRTLRNMTIAAHMSFRPYMAIRNIQQPWLTVAPRIGNEYVFEAMKKVNKAGPEYLQDLIRQDIVVHGRAAMLELAGHGKGKVDAYNRLGMTWMRNSDDWNRAVTASAVWIPYDEAVNKLQRGVIKPEEFLRASKLNLLAPAKQTPIVRLTEVGQFDRAKALLAKTWIDETQFTYVAATDPRPFKGVVGRLFGHYGHFPVNFRENMTRTFADHLSFGTKVEAAARLATNSAALYFIFERALGINARNYNPVTMSTFAGGPYYDLMNTTLQSTQGGYQGREARSRLLEDTARTFLPGASFLYSIGQAQSLMEDGHTLEGLLRFASFPVVDPRNPNAR